MQICNVSMLLHIVKDGLREGNIIKKFNKKKNSTICHEVGSIKTGYRTPLVFIE